MAYTRRNDLGRSSPHGLVVPSSSSQPLNSAVEFAVSFGRLHPWIGRRSQQFAGRTLKLRIPDHTAETRIVSGGPFWPSRRRLPRFLKYIVRTRIREFESLHPSHAVGLRERRFRENGPGHAARVHHAARRRGRCVADRGARAAGGDAGQPRATCLLPLASSRAGAEPTIRQPKRRRLCTRHGIRPARAPPGQ
jgi:hypothetical protein